MNRNQNAAQSLSRAVEHLLVARNLRGMARLQTALQPGYCLRAARLIDNCLSRADRAPILIGTGFPVLDTFETDGPVGALALYQVLDRLGGQPMIVCEPPLSLALSSLCRVHEIRVTADAAQTQQQAQLALQQLQPGLIIAIERPGLAGDGHYYNMRGEDIGRRVAGFDSFLQQASCPSIGIGDGGNEIGMGNVADRLSSLTIIPSVTRCSELVIADVSNWGALGILALLGWLRQRDLLAELDPEALLQHLSRHGSVDGVTRANTLTEDGLPASEGLALIRQLRTLTGFL